MTQFTKTLFVVFFYSLSAVAQIVNLIPSCGKPGDKICISGSGWAEPNPVCRYTFAFDGANVAPDQQDGLFGPPNTSFIVPGAAADGKHTVHVELRLNSPDQLLQQKNAPFTVITAAGTPTVSSSIGAGAGGAGQSITLTFDPSKGCSSSCQKIVFIQTVRRFINTATGEKLTKSSDWNNLDPDGKKTAVETGTENRRVDQYPGLTSPYYEQNNGLVNAGQDDGTGQVGSSGGTSNKSTLRDQPDTPAGSFPAGATEAILRFESCPFCAQGDDAGKFLGMCIKWEQHQLKGQAGTVSNVTVSGNPSAGYTDALNLWNSKKGFTPPTPKTSPCP